MPEEKLVTVRQVVERTGISRNTVYALVKRGEMPHIPIGERIYFRLSRIDRWFEEREEGSMGEAA